MKRRAGTRFLWALGAVWLASAYAEAQPANPTIVKTETGNRLDALFSYMAEHDIGIAAVVEKNGEVILAKGYGWSDREKRIPVTVDTVISTGSITKQFTATAILKLEAEGKLSVHDPITKYFDEVGDEQKDITIHHLLTHSAGLRPGFGADEQTIGRDELMEKALARKLKWSPKKKRYSYSNAGYSVLAAIVEKVSGLPYEQYLHDTLFAPAGMSDTGYTIPEWDPDRLAQGYTRDGKRWGTILDFPWLDDGPGWNLRGNGGILSTVWDMYHWKQALAEGKVLTAEVRDTELFFPHQQEEEGSDWYYAYGWSYAKTQRGTRLITHNGSNGVFYADWRWYIDDGVYIYYATNTYQLMKPSYEQAIRSIALLDDYDWQAALEKASRSDTAGE